MTRILNFLLLIAVVCSCAPRLAITPVADPGARGNAKGYLLALPRTVLMVSVEYSKTTHSAGPYAEYAQKFLGLTNVVSEDSIAWRIENINITSRQEADPGKYYLLKSDCRFSPEMLQQLSSKGFIIDPLRSDYSPISTAGNLTSQSTQASFNDLSVKNFYHEKTDTLFKVLFRDSVFVRLPVYKDYIQPKNTEEKARETADLIIKIRTQRMNLLVPEDMEDIENKPADILLKNLDLLEEKYLTLFTGISRTEKRSEIFCIIPGMKNATDTVLLNSCIIDSLHNKPITAVFSKTDMSSAADSIIPFKQGLLCRIPARTSVEFFCSGQIISQSFIYLSQSGAVTFIPAKNLRIIK